MALCRAFLLQALVLGAAVGSASASARGLKQFLGGKGIGMTAQAVQVATPIPMGPAMLAPVNMAPIITGAVSPGAGVYPYPMTTPVAVGATMVDPKQKLASFVAGAAAAHGKGGGLPYGGAIAGATVMPGFIGAAPMFAGGIQYQYVPQQVNIPVPAAAAVAPAHTGPDMESLRSPLEALGDAIRDEANKTASSLRPNYQAAAGQARAEADKAMGEVRPHIEAFAKTARSFEPKHVSALGRIAGAAHNGTAQLPDVARIFDRANDVASAMRERVAAAMPTLPGRGPKPAAAAVAAQAYQPAVVMTPMPVTSVVPVVSSAVTMPAYIAKPKGKGFGGYLGK
ncbi:hypothetical protein Rsub_04943 [Raphidocelis subcapitata]|uniref:Uncharacterized protein n=1 Tax=Raphidocelis subcapitata TaxID=307507 RepID=A0A2V0NW15_9CHLO|nr:hypothetical protein Rsub_04943 [Raphidocelis subcapitata]|eukprot:GBF91838.1 hypothetical protein Rsub_04943 [Raphidocelis subcapitata]